MRLPRVLTTPPSTHPQQVPKLKVKRDWHVNMDPNFVDSYVMNSMFDHEGSG